MTQPAQTLTPIVERLGGLLVRLVMDISARLSWGGITQPVLGEVARLLGDNKRQIDRVVALIRAGEYRRRQPRLAPRESAGPGAPRPPRPPGPVARKFGWLLPHLPAQWQGVGNRVKALIEEPEMAAMIQAAPVSLGRPLRSLCWAFRVRPPPVLAPPRRPGRPRPQQPRPEQPPARRPPPDVLANWPHASPLLKRAGLQRWRPRDVRPGSPKLA